MDIRRYLPKRLRQFFDTLTASGQSTDASVDLASTLALAAGTAARTLKVMHLGNSITAITHLRRAFAHRLRQTRGDFRQIGTLRAQPVVDGSSFDGAFDSLHEGHAGYKIEELNAGRVADSNTGYPGWVASAGTPDLVTIEAGANNWGDTGATQLMKMAALLATIKATTPNARVVVAQQHMPSTAFVATIGAPAYATLATELPIYNAGLAAVVAAAGERFAMVSPGLDFGDLQSDGLHPLRSGCEKYADAFAAGFQSAFPTARGLIYPRTFRKRVARPALIYTTAHYGTVTDDACELKSGQNYALALSIYPTTLTGLQTIAQYGNAYTDGFLFAATNDTFTLYLIDATPLGGYAVPGKIKLNAWNRVILHLDWATKIISVWVDGTLRGYWTRATWPAVVAKAFYIGKCPALNGVPGCYANVSISRGAACPALDAGLREAVEADYYEGIPLAGRTAFFGMTEGAGGNLYATDYAETGNSTSQMGVGVMISPAGNGGWSAAGTLPMPWDE